MREVTAYASNDGRVYATPAEAAEADARMALERLGLLKGETINFIIQNAAVIVEAVSGLAEHSNKEHSA